MADEAMFGDAASKRFAAESPAKHQRRAPRCLRGARLLRYSSKCK